MKISIGAKFIEGPFGGGNEFIKNLGIAFEKDGHIVVNNLKDRDIDIIFLINPLIDSEISTFNNYDIDYYLAFKNSGALTIQRINECDERKNTTNINKKLIRFNKNIDINIFVSDWLKKIFLDQGIKNKKSLVMKGGPSKILFKSQAVSKLPLSSKIKIVTHHWSGNVMKGLKTYEKLDKILDNQEFNKRFEFTYIGNISHNHQLKNTKILKPLNGTKLITELKKHHIYITGSINEPSGNHHMEAAMLGLPILYLNSGGTPEFCKEYGVEFNEDNLSQKLIEIVEKYDQLTLSLKDYPYSFEKAYELLNLFLKEVLTNKYDILSKRKFPTKIEVILLKIYSSIKKICFKVFVLTKVKLGNLKNSALNIK